MCRENCGTDRCAWNWRSANPAIQPFHSNTACQLRFKWKSSRSHQRCWCSVLPANSYTQTRHRRHRQTYGSTACPSPAVGCSLLGNTQEFIGSQAFTGTQGGSLIGLPNLAGRNFCLSKSANGGIVVGSCPTSESANLGDELPVIWQHGVVSQLPLPTGYTIGAAHSVNASGIAVGSVGSVGSQRGVIYTGNNVGIITQTTPGGSFFTARKPVAGEGM